MEGGTAGRLLHLEDVTYAVGGATILEGVTLDLGAGETVAVVGPSGSGKTTLLHVALTLVRPTSGSVRIMGHDVSDMSRRERRQLRAQQIGVIFQFGELLPELTPWENVMLPAWFADLPKRDKDRFGERGEDLLRTLGVTAHDRPARTLSGGERQRVAVARALINDPSVVLADEPTGALDTRSTARVADILLEIPRGGTRGLLIVTHDLALASRADRVLHLEDGLLRERAMPATAEA